MRERKRLLIRLSNNDNTNIVDLPCFLIEISNSVTNTNFVARVDVSTYTRSGHNPIKLTKFSYNLTVVS